MDVFLILQLTEVYAPGNNFQVRAKVENNNITRNSSRSDSLTTLGLLSADAKSTVVLTVPSLNFAVPETLKNSIFEVAIILQTLKINNLSAKSITQLENLSNTL